jgi:hypothetical protein
MRYLRKNTAVIVSVGPFYDKTDGVTIETGLTITNERITLVADTDDGSAPTNILDNVTGATSGTDNDLNYITGNDAGMMQLELTAANTNRNGRLLLSITDAANHVPVFHEFTILPANVYDALIAGTDTLETDNTQWLGQAIAAADTNGYPKITIKSGTGTGEVSLASGVVAADVTKVSGDSTAADNLEAILDGTGGQAKFINNSTTPGLHIRGDATGNGLYLDTLVGSGKVMEVMGHDATNPMQIFVLVGTGGGLAEQFALDVTGQVLNQARASFNVASSIGEALNNAAGLTATKAGYLDAAVSTRLATSGYTAPLTAATTRSALGLASANLDTQFTNIPGATVIAAGITGGDLSTQIADVFQAVENVPGAVRTNLATELARIDVAISTRAEAVAASSGAYTVTVTVTDGTTPLEGAKVRYSEGVNSYIATTNASGQCTFALDAATYSVAVTKAGYTFTPITNAVSANESVTHAMTVVSVTPAADPTQTTGYLTTRTGGGTAEGSVVVWFQLLTPAGSTDAYSGTPFPATSSGSGALTVTLMRSSTYRARRGTASAWVEFTTLDASTYPLPELLETE